MDHVEARRRLETMALSMPLTSSCPSRWRTSTNADLLHTVVGFIRQHQDEWTAYTAPDTEPRDEVGDLVDEAYELVKDRELGL